MVASICLLSASGSGEVMIPDSFFFVFIFDFFDWFGWFKKHCMISLAFFSFLFFLSLLPGFLQSEGHRCGITVGCRHLGFLLLDIRFSLASFFWMDIMDLCASCAVQIPLDSRNLAVL